MVPNSALFKKWQSQIWNWHHFFCSEITFYRLKWTVSLRPIQRQYLYFLNRCWSWWKYQYKNFPGVRRKFPGNENWEYLGDSPIFQKLGNSPANRGNPFPGNMQQSCKSILLSLFYLIYVALWVVLQIFDMHLYRKSKSTSLFRR